MIRRHILVHNHWATARFLWNFVCLTAFPVEGQLGSWCLWEGVCCNAINLLPGYKVYFRHKIRFCYSFVCTLWNKLKIGRHGGWINELFPQNLHKFKEGIPWSIWRILMLWFTSREEFKISTVYLVMATFRKTFQLVSLDVWSTSKKYIHLILCNPAAQKFTWKCTSFKKPNSHLLGNHFSDLIQIRHLPEVNK